MWDKFVEITYWLWGVPLLAVIVIAGLLFTILGKGFQVRHLGRILAGPFKKDPEIPESKNKLTPFQAVSIAIGGSVGVSNISGVGTAIATGGPGALFWLWVAATLGMMIKMVEVSLAVYYRTTASDGTHFGGPTYYMQKGLGEEKGFKPWVILAFLFGGGLFITLFITLQNYTISEAVATTFNIPYMVPSIIMVISIYAIILGGLKRVGEIAGYLVPFMCIFYVACVLVVLIMNASSIPGAFVMIFRDAFTPQAAVGGFAGAGVAKALQLGFARSVYSNEAGWGTSPMVHATAETNHPIKQGMLGAFEVFADTMIVCTATGLLVIVTGFWSSGVMGAELTLNALQANIGFFARIVVAFSIFFFGLTTATGWYTYYYVLLTHAFKNEATREKVLKVYKMVTPIPGCVLTYLTVYGGGTPAQIWVLADFSTVIPTFINVAVLIFLSKTFLTLLKDYNARYLGIGKVDPNLPLFYEDKIAAGRK